MIKCCKGCTKRKVGCHSSCAIYHLEKSEHEAKREKDKREREIFYGVSGQRHRKIEQCAKRRKGIKVYGYL